MNKFEWFDMLSTAIMFPLICLLIFLVIKLTNIVLSNRFGFSNDDTRFQKRLFSWLKKSTSIQTAYNPSLRVELFIKKSLELSQSIGMSRDRLVELVNYTYNKPTCRVDDSIVGVTMSLAALSEARDMDIILLVERELDKYCDENRVSSSSDVFRTG